MGIIYASEEIEGGHLGRFRKVRRFMGVMFSTWVGVIGGK